MSENKGERFEDLVQDLLSKQHPKLDWKRTRRTHDGKRDFEIGLTDEFFYTDEYWVECKNRSANISIDTLSPTLVMAVIKEVKAVFFFTPTKLNDNARNYITQFKSKTGLKFQLIEDEILEEEILKHDSILKQYFPGISIENRSRNFGTKQELQYRINLQRDVSYDYSSKTIVTQLQNKNAALNVNETFCIDVFVSNKTDADRAAILFLKPNEFKRHFSCLSEQLKRDHWKVDIRIDKASIEFHRFVFKLEQYHKTIPLPKVYSICEDGTEVELSLGNINCSWVISTPIIGRGRLEFLDIIQNETVGINKGRIFTYYGRSGTGKSRLLKETNDVLLSNNFRIVSVDGDFQASESSGFQVLKKWISEVVGLPQTEILAGTSNSKKQLTGHTNKLIRALYEDSFLSDNLSIVIDDLVEKISNSKFAFVIDNVQFFNEDIGAILNELIRKSVGKTSGICLVLSFNTDFVIEQSHIGTLFNLVREKGIARTNFVFDFEVLDFSTADAEKFVSHCIPDLREKYPKTFAFALEGLDKSPLYIEQTLLHMFDLGVIRKRKDYFYIFDINGFHSLLKQLPPRIEGLFLLRWRFIQEQVESRKFEVLLKYLALLQQVSFSLLDELEIHLNKVRELVQLGFLDVTSTNQVVFRHQKLQTFFYETFFSSGVDQEICSRLLIITDKFNLKELYPSQWFIAKNTLDPLDSDVVSFGLDCLFEGKVARELKVTFSLKLFEAVKRFSSLWFGQISIIRAFTRICDEIKDYGTFSMAVTVYKQVYEIMSSDQKRFYSLGDDYFQFVIRYSNSFLSLHLDSSAHELLLSELDRLERFEFSEDAQRKRLKAAILNRLCVTYKSANYPEQAEIVGSESLKIASELQDHSLMIKNFIDIGYIYYKNRKKQTELLANWDEAWKMFLAAKDESVERRRVSAYFHRALTSLIRGKYDESLNYVEQGILWADIRMDVFNKIKLTMVKSLVFYLGKNHSNESPADYAQIAIDLCVRYSSNRSYWKSHYLLGKVTSDHSVKNESYLVALELLSTIIVDNRMEERYLYFFEDMAISLRQFSRLKSEDVDEKLQTCIRSKQVRSQVKRILNMDNERFAEFLYALEPKTNITDGRTSFPNP